MFRRLLLLASLLCVAYSWCTPFVACNQTVYGDFSDPESGMKIVLLGRPFQKNDELLITGEFYNNGSDVMDDATFSVGLSKGLIMHQLGEDPKQYLLTTTLGANATAMNVTGLLKYTLSTFNYGVKSIPQPVLSCAEPFVFKLKSVDGFGFAFGNGTVYAGKVPSQYPKNISSQSVFFNGQFKTSKMELRCID
ncbi:unnamed protein product [Caenorhabditis sp. 36 PRJEB53466]|nr:unnamed protein product [Caenorhabditis sp. 36 PRJEB53466]